MHLGVARLVFRQVEDLVLRELHERRGDNSPKQIFGGLLPESPGHNLASTVFYVPREQEMREGHQPRVIYHQFTSIRRTADGHLGVVTTNRFSK